MNSLLKGGPSVSGISVENPSVYQALLTSDSEPSLPCGRQQLECLQHPFRLPGVSHVLLLEHARVRGQLRGWGKFIHRPWGSPFFCTSISRFPSWVSSCPGSSELHLLIPQASKTAAFFLSFSYLAPHLDWTLSSGECCIKVLVWPPPFKGWIPSSFHLHLDFL